MRRKPAVRKISPVEIPVLNLENVPLKAVSARALR